MPTVSGRSCSVGPPGSRCNRPGSSGCSSPMGRDLVRCRPPSSAARWWGWRWSTRKVGRDRIWCSRHTGCFSVRWRRSRRASGRRSVGWGGALFLLSDATIIVGEHVAKTPRQRAVVSGTIMATYAAALALLVHGLRDEPAPLDPVQPDPVPEDPTA